MKNQQRKNGGVRWTAALSAVALLAVGAGSAAAAPARSGEGVRPQGVQVHIDQVSGKIRQPTPAELKVLADAFHAKVARSAEGVQVTEHADGSLSATLGPESLNVWVAAVGADGSIRYACIEGGEAVPVAPTLEEK